MIHVWDYSVGRHVSSIETISDAPGNRFAISDDAEIVVAGAFSGRGVTAYRTADGANLWRRTDVTEVQSVSIVGDRCFIEIDSQRAKVLSLESGKTLEHPFRSVKLWASHDAKLLVGTDRRHIHFIRGPNVEDMQMAQLSSFTVLDVAFSDLAILVSEPNCCIRAFRAGDFEPLWEWTDPDRRNYVSIFETITPGSMFAFGSRLEEPHKHRVYKIDVLSGERTLVLELRSPQFNVCVDYSGTNLIDNCGNVYTISEDANVQKVRQLEWP